MNCALAYAGVVVGMAAMAACSEDRLPVNSVQATAPAATVIAQAFDSTQLSVAYERAERLPRVRSFIVQWKGDVIGEKYYHGATRTTRANIKSASKSIVSALVGIAIEQGKIRSVNQTIGELLPVETRNLDSVKRSITVGDLLSMRSGLQSTSFNNYGGWVSSRNWVANALGRPLVSEPGGQMIYSTASTHLLSAIITRATRMDTHRFALRNLAAPLGINLRPWQRDPQGILFGGNDMFMTPRDMLKVGTLFLNGGAAGGRQIVPRAWIDTSFVPRTVSPFNGNRYGYGWWLRTANGHDVHYAWGYGGQFIFVVPDLQLVVVTTSDAESARDGGHTRELHRILEEDVINAVSRRDERTELVARSQRDTVREFMARRRPAR